MSPLDQSFKRLGWKRAQMTERDRQRERWRHTKRERDNQIETYRERKRDRQSKRQRARETQRQREREKERIPELCTVSTQAYMTGLSQVNPNGSRSGNQPLHVDNFPTKKVNKKDLLLINFVREKQ